MLKVMTAAQLAAKLEELSREGRDQFIKVIVECDDSDLTLALLDTFRLTSPETIGILAQVVSLRERGASEGEWAIWHERAKAHARHLVGEGN